MLVIAALFGVGGGYVGALLTFEPKLDFFETEVSGLSLTVHQLENESILRESEISTLESQLDTYDIERIDQQNKVLELEINNENLTRKVIAYQGELVELQTNCDLIQTENDELWADFLELETLHFELEASYDYLYEEYQTWNDAYTALQETYDLYSVDLYRKISFNITLPSQGRVEREWFFDIGYGIILKTWFSVNIEIYSYQEGSGSSWTRGGQSGFLGSSGRTWSQLPTVLTGYAFCEIYDSGGSQISVKVGVRPEGQTEWIGRECSGTWPKVLDE